MTECLELAEAGHDVRWMNLKVTYDNVGMGYLSLLQVVSNVCTQYAFLQSYRSQIECKK